MNKKIAFSCILFGNHQNLSPEFFIEIKKRRMEISGLIGLKLGFGSTGLDPSAGAKNRREKFLLLKEGEVRGFGGR